MTIDDMHIAVNQGVDKIHSLQADILLSEEIDHELNKNILRFINQRFTPLGNKYQQGFEQSQKRIDDLRTLLTEATLDVTFKENLLNGKIFVDKGQLPSDYLYLVRQSSKVAINRCQPIKFSFETGEAFFGITIDAADLSKDDSYFTSFQYFENPSVNTSIDIYNDPDGVLNSTSFPIQPTVLDYLVTNGSNTPAGFISPGFAALPTLNFDKLIIVINVDAIQFQPGVSQALLTYSDGSTKSFNFVNESPDSKRIPTGLTTKEIHPNKFVQHDDIFKLLTDPFNKTKHTAPLSTITNDQIEVYTDDTFLIEDLRVLYIKKPDTVSKTSTPQVNCNLPDHTHQEIVDMTVSTILGNISDPRYQISAAEKMQAE